MIKAALIAWFNATLPMLGNRIHANYCPQNEPCPRMVLQTIHDERTKTLAGYDGLLKSSIQADVYAQTYTDIAAIHKALVALFRGGAKQSVAGFTIQWCWLEDATDSYIYPDQGDDRGLHRLMLEFTIWSNE